MHLHRDATRIAGTARTHILRATQKFLSELCRDLSRGRYHVNMNISKKCANLLPKRLWLIIGFYR